MEYALLVALAEHPYRSVPEVDISDIEPHKLRQTHTAVEKEHEYAEITLLERILRVHLLYEPFAVIKAEIFGLALSELGLLKILHRIAVKAVADYLAAAQCVVEALDG